MNFVYFAVFLCACVFGNAFGVARAFGNASMSESTIRSDLWWTFGRARALVYLYNNQLATEKYNLHSGYDSSTHQCMRLLSAQILNSSSPRLSLSDKCREILDRNLLYSTRIIQNECRDANHRRFRSPYGLCNDLKNLWAGAKHYRLGRNMPSFIPKNIYDPDPFLIAQRLFTRKKFTPAKIVNMLAVGWSQFMVHDWFIHFGDNHGKTLFRPKHCIKPNLRSHGDCLQFENRETHWWDASQVYGSTRELTLRLRTMTEGKLKIGKDKSLPKQLGTAIPLAGVPDGWWAGLHLLHTIFTLEHNAICDMLQNNYKHWDDDRLYNTARLINAALMARIHGMEWTKAILRNRVAHIGLDIRWKDLTLGQVFGPHNVKMAQLLTKERLPNKFLRSVGQPPKNHNVSFSLTEEFLSIYRMHSLLSDRLAMWNASTGRPQGRSQDMAKLSLKHTTPTIREEGLDNVLLSFGMESAGALVLHNYPNFLRSLEIKDGVTSRKSFDLAAVDIIRDRERGVPRYNEFRRLMGLPPLASFLEMTGGDASAAARLESLYRSVDQVDLMVGLHAEQPRPSGFGFSNTAFQLLFLMAKRRLEADRFYTTEYRKETYTEQGIAWVEKTRMQDILQRHFPQLRTALLGVTNAFAPWNSREYQTPLNFTEPWN